MSTLLSVKAIDIPSSLLERGVEARFAGEWLRMTAPLPRGSAEDRLRAAASLPPRLRFALNGSTTPHLDADLLLGVDASSAFEDVCAGFNAALDGMPFRGANDSVEIDLVGLCSEAGFEFHPRRVGGGSVSLDAPPEGGLAVLTPQGAGLHVAVDFQPLENAGAASRAAIARLLLRAAGHVRLVRPALTETHRALVPRFEIVFFAPPSVPLLGHGLGALSTAAALTASECLALGDEAVAREYLAMQASACLNHKQEE